MKTFNWRDNKSTVCDYIFLKYRSGRKRLRIIGIVYARIRLGIYDSIRGNNRGKMSCELDRIEH